MLTTTHSTQVLPTSQVLPTAIVEDLRTRAQFERDYYVLDACDIVLDFDQETATDADRASFDHAVTRCRIALREWVARIKRFTYDA